MMFDEEYYRSNNYTDYLRRGDRYVKLADEVVGVLDQFNLPHDTVLDFGCAVGHLLIGLKPHCEFVYGSDVSEWAVMEATKKGLYVTNEPLFEKQHDVVFSLDVFEHMKLAELNEFMENIKTKCIVFRMPVCRPDEDDYVLEVSRKDPTHEIRWSKELWRKWFDKWGYKCLDLNLHTIYNSEGVYSGIALCF